MNGTAKPKWYEKFDTRTQIPAQYMEAFQRELKKINLQSSRIMTMVGFLLVPPSAVLDYFIYPQHLGHFLQVRAIMSLSCLLLFGLSFVKGLQRHSTILASIAILVVGGGIAYMVRVLGYEDPYYAGLNLIYLTLMIAPWGILRTLIPCFIVYGFYLVPILLYDLHDLNVPAFVNNNVFQLEMIFIAGVVNHFQSRRRQKEIVNRLTIAQQAKELEEIDHYKREFISNVTHELKTPLAIALGNADLILDKTEDEELRQGLYLIRKSALQLANHVDRIIAVTNVDDPDAKPDLGNYDYCGVVQSIFSVFESRARSENITFALNMAPGPIVVNIDIVQIEEVLSNLIQNAFKFTPNHGMITVTVSTDGEQVFTEVSDSGIGIPADRIGKIFDRLYQADEVLSKRHSGIGLGLYICRKNVEIHGGEIFAHSLQGKGTSFKFSLPLHVDQSVMVKNAPFDGDERRAQLSRRRGDERRSGSDRRMAERRKNFEYQQRMGLDELAQMTFTDNVRDFENRNPGRPTIMILEDNAGMMKVIVEALKDDYNLLLAFDAFQGLRKLEASQNQVSLILSDIMMPGMNGFEFLENVMSKEEYRHIPLIFITALMNQDDQLKGYALGATDYIVKPYSIKILKEKVDHWITRRQYERLLKEASETLEERVRQLTRAKDIILHEIGNPLQMISGASYFIDKLRQMSLSHASDRERQLWESSLALDHGIRAIRGVLETTKSFDLGRVSLRQPEYVEGLLHEAVELTRHFLGEVTLNLSTDDLGGMMIYCDRKMLIQVIVNLIRNGQEAILEKNPDGKGNIDIRTELTDDHHLLIQVRDNGIGMDGEVLERLFAFRYTNKKNGTGIGLHLAKMILKFHDGTISVASQKGVGSTFTLTLPMPENSDVHKAIGAVRSPMYN